MVQIITDSTADFPPNMIKELGIRVVPIYVRFGNNVYRDGVDILKNEFYSMLLSSPIHPATSQPNPEDFVCVYKEYCKNNDGIVSIHISSKISGTYNSAMLAQKTMENRCPIQVIDSTFNSAGLGLVVMGAARLAKSGASFSEIVYQTNKTINEVRMFGMFGTMKYLARSGRVNKTIATASEILHVMPLLTFRDGEIIRAGLVRTINKGIERIYDFVRNNTPITDVIIVHSKVADQAYQLKVLLSKIIEKEKIAITELGAGLGVHGGPGVLLASLRKSDIA